LKKSFSITLSFILVGVLISIAILYSHYLTAIQSGGVMINGAFIDLPTAQATFFKYLGLKESLISISGYAISGLIVGILVSFMLGLSKRNKISGS
jgi:hypothetical protein